MGGQAQQNRPHGPQTSERALGREPAFGVNGHFTSITEPLKLKKGNSAEIFGGVEK